jgi:hypothetical protein
MIFLPDVEMKTCWIYISQPGFTSETSMDDLAKTKLKS